ncbi:MAG: hypothetical protein ABI383_16195 [Acidobacteriaceae bacterium]
MKKKLLGIGLPLLVLACCLVLFSCARDRGAVKGRRSNIEFGDDYVVFNPLRLSAEEKSRLEDILAKYDMSLYRIKNFKDGTTEGALSYSLLSLKTIQSIVAGRNASGKNAVALRTGRGRGSTSMLPFHPEDSDNSDDKKVVNLGRGRGGTSLRHNFAESDSTTSSTNEGAVGPGGTRLRSPTPPPTAQSNRRAGGTRLKFDDHALAQEVKELLQNHQDD